jgi:NADPH-dependent ferric siderophore reductase
VLEAEAVAPRLRRVRLGGEGLVGLPWTPGQQVRIVVADRLLGPELLTRDALRTYSVWQCDAARGTLDLCILLHGDGPGCRWARTVAVGAPVAVFGPKGSFVLDPTAPHHVFAGEETATVAIGAMLAALPPNAEAIACLEADAPEDAPPLPGDGARRVVHRVLRRGRPAGPQSGLLDAVRALVLPTAPGVAYVAGEAAACVALRNHFVRERGWPRGRVRVKPFWSPGKKGLE